MNPDTSFCEKIEKCMSYRHPKAIRPKPKRGKLGPFRVPFGTPKVLNWLLDTERSFMFGCCLDFSSRVFWQVLAPRRIFILRLWFFFISFLDNSGFFKNNYLVDKYLKINLNKVQIIHARAEVQNSCILGLVLVRAQIDKYWILILIHKPELPMR